MKKKNTPSRILTYYRKELEKYIHEEEIQAALEQPIRLNLTNVRQYSAYYQGARAGLIKAMEWSMMRMKGEEKVYVQAELDLIKKDLRHAEMFLSGQPIRYRNHERKGKKLIKCEAYFFERVTIDIEVE